MEPFLRRLPDGQIWDTRWRFTAGDILAVTKGDHAGARVTVTIRAYDQRSETPGYHVTLPNGRVVFVAWDAVRLIKPGPLYAAARAEEAQAMRPTQQK